MTAYGAILSARFRALLQYRGAAIAGMGTQIFWGLMRIMIVAAFYESTTQARPMAFTKVVTYIWLSQALFRMVPWMADPEIGHAIRSGDVVYHLLRPLTLYGGWFARAVATLTAPTVLRAVPLVLVVALFGGIDAPPSAAALGLALVAVFNGILLGAAIMNALHVSLLWTVSGDGITRLLSVAVFMFSGMAIPLPLLPSNLQPLVAALPFRGVMDTPMRIYLGEIAVSAAPAALAHQLVWTGVLAAVSVALVRRYTYRLAIQGG